MTSLEDPVNTYGMVRDVGFRQSVNASPIGLDRDGCCRTWSQAESERFDT
jgi:hypothetical protein